MKGRELLLKLKHARLGPTPDGEPRWIVTAYVGDRFLDLRIGRHRWRFYV